MLSGVEFLHTVRLNGIARFSSLEPPSASPEGLSLFCSESDKGAQSSPSNRAAEGTAKARALSLQASGVFQLEEARECCRPMRGRHARHQFAGCLRTFGILPSSSHRDRDGDSPAQIPARSEFADRR